MATPKSAKSGTGTWNGTTIGNLTDISFDDAQDLDVYASSSTAGQKSRIAGHQDASGSFTMIEPPTFAKGDEGVLVLKEDGTIESFNGGAIIGNIQRGIPVEDGTRLTYTIEWGQKPDASSGA